MFLASWEKKEEGPSLLKEEEDEGGLATTDKKREKKEFRFKQTMQIKIRSEKSGREKENEKDAIEVFGAKKWDENSILRNHVEIFCSSFICEKNNLNYLFHSYIFFAPRQMNRAWKWKICQLFYE